MNRLKIKVPKGKIAEFCRRWNVSEFAIFGSALRGDFRPDSDVDVLVSFKPQAHITLFDMVHMQDELKAIFGREVDLISKRGVENSRNYLRRKTILDSAWDEFYEDLQCQDAVVRRTLAPYLLSKSCVRCSAGVEIIGEAARRVSQAKRDSYPQIPWREMTSMRNLVIHEYDVVDINQVWDTVQNKLPPLIEELAKIVPPE